MDCALRSMRKIRLPPHMYNNKVIIYTNSEDQKRTSALDVRTAYRGGSGHRRGGAGVSTGWVLFAGRRRPSLCRPGVHRRPAAAGKGPDTATDEQCKVCKICTVHPRPYPGLFRRLPAGDGPRTAMDGCALRRGTKPSRWECRRRLAGGRTRPDTPCGRPVRTSASDLRCIYIFLAASCKLSL